LLTAHNLPLARWACPHSEPARRREKHPGVGEVVLQNVAETVLPVKKSRSPGDDADEAKAEAGAAAARRVPVAVGRAAEVAVGAPRTSAHNSETATSRRLRPSWILPRALVVVVLLVPVGTPLPDVAVHVEQSKSVGLVGADRRRALQIITFC